MILECCFIRILTDVGKNMSMELEAPSEMVTIKEDIGALGVMTRMVLRALIAAAVGLLIWLPVSGAGLTKPPELKAEVGFWKRVFSEVPTRKALVHDNRHLGVVYEIVDIQAGGSNSQRRRQAEKVRRKYRDILISLADGDRSSLTREERRVLALWPAGITNDELREAAGRVRFQGGLSDRFVDGLVRSGSWRDYISQQLKASSVPRDLVALPHVESSFNPYAGSSAGAVGLWQFTRPTGRRFMQIDHVVDERRDPFISSSAAAQLLSYNYSVLNSWPLAITAYNHGVAGMRRAVKQMGTEDIEAIVLNYSGKRFGFASRNFYVAFLAASDIDSNHRKYFGTVKMNKPANDLVVNMPGYMEFDRLTEILGVSGKTLGQYNPALMSSVIEGNKYVPRGFSLRVPGSVKADELLASAPGQDIYSAQTPDMYHKVQRGDSLSVLAVRYKTSVRELRALNNLSSSHFIRIGQVLRLPYSDQQGSITAETYTVRSGDSLSVIAARAGTTKGHLMKINNLADGNRIYAGQKLQVQSRVALVEPTPVAAQPASVVAVGPAETEEASTASGSVDLSVASVDPSDYGVADDGTVEVQAGETMGHYADWLSVSTQSLRDLNGYSFGQSLVTGARIRLKFQNVSVDKFVQKRSLYHQELHESFFVQYRIVTTNRHTLKRGESVWLVNKRYRVPEWLLRQYNPDLDLNRVQQGTVVVFPEIEEIDVDA